jgi:hypothetical protein
LRGAVSSAEKEKVIDSLTVEEIASRHAAMLKA